MASLVRLCVPLRMLSVEAVNDLQDQLPTALLSEVAHLVGQLAVVGTGGPMEEVRNLVVDPVLPSLRDLPHDVLEIHGLAQRCLRTIFVAVLVEDRERADVLLPPVSLVGRFDAVVPGVRDVLLEVRGELRGIPTRVLAVVARAGQEVFSQLLERGCRDAETQLFERRIFRRHVIAQLPVERSAASGHLGPVSPVSEEAACPGGVLDEAEGGVVVVDGADRSA
mmetsp:Transcript_38887/g.78495  ORF Transcript_38887/g.78495 Transcript_38887/m.78495 type:complete len:223 (+) Transcript_38887:91-759(+)